MCHRHPLQHHPLTLILQAGSSPFPSRAPCSPANVLSHKCCLSPFLPNLPLYRACIPPLQPSRITSYPSRSLCKCTQNSRPFSLFPCCMHDCPGTSECTDSPEKVRALPTMLSCRHFFIYVYTLGGHFSPLLLFAGSVLTISPCTFYLPTTSSLECGHHLPLLLFLHKALHTRLVNLLSIMHFPPFFRWAICLLRPQIGSIVIKASVVGTTAEPEFQCN